MSGVYFIVTVLNVRICGVVKKRLNKQNFVFIRISLLYNLFILWCVCLSLSLVA
jgi:hypothetical protein